MRVATKIGRAVLLFCLLFPQPLLSQEFAEVLEMELVVHFIDVGIGDAIEINYYIL